MQTTQNSKQRNANNAFKLSNHASRLHAPQFENLPTNNDATMQRQQNDMKQRFIKQILQIAATTLTATVQKTKLTLLKYEKV